MPYGTGSCRYCACIAKVAFLSIFNVFYNLHGLPQKRITCPYRKKKNDSICFTIYTSYRKQKLQACTAKKNTPLDNFSHTSYIFHSPMLESGGQNQHAKVNCTYYHFYARKTRHTHRKTPNPTKKKHFPPLPFRRFLPSAPTNPHFLPERPSTLPKKIAWPKCLDDSATPCTHT